MLIDVNQVLAGPAEPFAYAPPTAPADVAKRQGIVGDLRPRPKLERRDELEIIPAQMAPHKVQMARRLLRCLQTHDNRPFVGRGGVAVVFGFQTVACAPTACGALQNGL